MSKLRDYIRLRMDYYEDDVLMSAADECAAAMHLWPILIGTAKRKSHVKENPDGSIRTTLNRLAKDAYVSVHDVRPALDALADGGLLTFAAEGKNRVRITLTNFNKWQNARGGSGDRMDHKRTNFCRDFMPHSDAPVTDPLRTRDTEREEEREEEKTNMSNNATQLSDRAEQIQNVFEYWTRTELETGGLGSTGKGRRPKLTKERRAKINARLGEGYSAADLKMAIAFYCRDPHHLGETNGTRYTDLTTTLKNGSKVEAGIAGYEARKSGGGLSPDVAAMLRQIGHTEAGAA